MLTNTQKVTEIHRTSRAIGYIWDDPVWVHSIHFGCLSARWKLDSTWFDMLRCFHHLASRPKLKDWTVCWERSELQLWHLWLHPEPRCNMGMGQHKKHRQNVSKDVKRFSASPWLYGFSKSFRNWILESGACLGPLLGCGSKSGIFETWLTCSRRQTGMFDHVNSWLQSASLGSDWESSAGQSLCSEGEQHTVSRENCPSQVRRNPSFNKKCSCWDNDKSMFGGLLQNCSVGNFAKGGESNFQQLRCTPATHLASP